MSVIFTGDLAAVCIIGVSIIARCRQGKNWLYSDKHSNLFLHVCPLWNFDPLEQSVIINFLPLSCVQSRPHFCIINLDIFYSDTKWNYRGVILTQKKKLPCMHKYFQSSGNNKVHFTKYLSLQAQKWMRKVTVISGFLSTSSFWVRRSMQFQERLERTFWPSTHVSLLIDYASFVRFVLLFLFHYETTTKAKFIFTLKKLAVEPEKHEDGLDKDGSEAAGEVSLIMSLVQNYNSLTQTITEMTRFKMPCGTYMYDPFWLISILNTAFLCKSKTLLSHYFS